MAKINTRIVHKHDVEANWLKATSFIPKQGELIVYDIDSTYDYERFKIGDGTTLVNDLPFYACSWNDLLDRPFGDNEDGTVSKLDDKYLNPVGQTSFGHTLVIGDIHQYPYVDFTSSKRWYKVSDNTPTDFTGMTLESNSPDMSPGDEITMIMYDGYACSNTASATNAYVLFVAYGNKIYQTEVLGPGIYVQENITYWEGDYIGSITLPNHEFTKSTIKEEYIPDTIARLKDVPAKPRITTVTLSASAWSGSSNPWSQTVTVDGVTANSRLELSPTAAQIVSLQNAEITLMLQNDAGTVSAWAIGNKPEEDYTMQVLLTEVIPV